jgi:hypothetical protein
MLSVIVGAAAFKGTGAAALITVGLPESNCMYRSACTVHLHHSQRGLHPASIGCLSSLSVSRAVRPCALACRWSSSRSRRSSTCSGGLGLTWYGGGLLACPPPSPHVCPYCMTHHALLRPSSSLTTPCTWDHGTWIAGGGPRSHATRWHEEGGCSPLKCFVSV